MPTTRRSTIDLNTADENTLIKKLNISSRLAKRIVAFRPYTSVDQLNKVWGLDSEVLHRILPLVTVAEQEKVPEVTQKEARVQAEPKAPRKRKEQTPAPTLPNLKPETVELSSNKPEEKIAWSLSALLPKKPRTPWKLNIVLLLILLAGAYFRFTGLNWDQGNHQHPDERFISMVSEQIRGVDGIAAYFNTDQSTLNPLRFGSYTYGMFPLFLTRMVAEWMKMSAYDTVTMVGRAMSGFFDLISVLMLYFLGKRLYNKRVGLLAAALGVAAVLPIQLSHYFTVDSFSTIFVVASVYFATFAIPLQEDEEKIGKTHLFYFGLFGFIVGLAGACKVNTLPVFGVIVLAGIARLILDWKKPDFRTVLKIILWGWALAAFFVILSFRIFQPYAFVGPGFFNLSLNPGWLRVLKEVVAQVAGNSDWPPNTHWTNRSITYAWTNMITWGLGLPLGLAGWLGWGWAAAQMWNGRWRSHLLPFVWVTTYFIWQNSQFWRYMRYFLPIYPFIILFAAWALVEIYDRTREGRSRIVANGYKLASQLSDWRLTWKAVTAFLVVGIVVLGTYIYAIAFTRIYNRPMTRIAASEWMLENISGPMNVIVDSSKGNHSYPVAIDNRQIAVPGDLGFANIQVLQDGNISKITTTNIQQVGVYIYFRLTSDEAGENILTEGRLAIDDDNQDQRQEISFGNINIPAGGTYYLHYKIQSSSQFSLSNVSLQNVDQGEGSIQPVNLNIASQTPGIFEGSFSLNPEKPLVLNRLIIEDFHQTFVPTQTTLRVVIYKKGDENNLLVDTSQSMNFTEPGMKLSPTFNFAPASVTGGQTYQVRYEIPSGAPLQLSGEDYTVETSWDDALPLNINQYNAQGGIFNPLNLELYEPDTPEKRDSMIKVLAQSDYIVIPSNRAYDAMPRLPLRYPLALKYYQLLFDCNCSGDALENRAYGLEPPFKSPLGFDLVATFESPPSLGFLKFPDQAADESFTVYDHPKVFIFKKSKDFSIDYVSAQLNKVNLDAVFFQTPLQFTRIPTAMQLPSDRLAAQAKGGTWSDMFNRNSFLNVNEIAGGLTWYLLLFFMGLIVFPFVFQIFSGLPDRGYPLIRMAGLILIAWLAWFLGSFKILPFSQLTIILYVVLVIILSLVTAYRRRQDLLSYFQLHWKQILGTEAIFLALFLFSLHVRLGNPDLWHPWLGGEKPMDFAFFNAVLKSVYFPPEHPWFSGHYINYYYYGYVIAAIPTKLLGIIPSIAYNLILPSWFAMTGIGIFSIGFNLIAGLRGQIENQSSPMASTFWGRLFNKNVFIKSMPYLAGAFAVFAILFLGNLYEVRVLWKYLPEAAVSGSNTTTFFEHAGAVVGGAIEVLTGPSDLPGDKGRWYFEASRPILHDGPDTPIAEFPYFTFLYGDMHPHLLIMPFYALAFGWILNLLLWPIINLKWNDRILSLAAAGLFFGVFRASHTWDFPTFLGLGAMAILWNIWQSRSGIDQKTVKFFIVCELAFAAVAVALYWPFTEWFKTEYASLEIWKGMRTPLFDYLFVFGIPIFVFIGLFIRDLRLGFKKLISVPVSSHFKWPRLLVYLIVLAAVYGLQKLWVSDYQVLAFGLPFLVGVAYVTFFNKELTILQKIAWILFGIGLFISLFVEVFVLKGDGGRSNTVFRFYNQAWFFLGLAVSLALVDLLNDLPNWPGFVKFAWSLILGILVLCAASYPLIATSKKMMDRWPNIQNPPHTLDGAVFMLGDANQTVGKDSAIYNDDNRLLNLGLDYAAILYMQDHVQGSPVIVEGHTEEYRWGSRFSIYTGLPSVVGWSWHVRQHNSLLDGSIVENRINEVNDFYNTEDIGLANRFLAKYGVRYIVVGDLERAYYAANGIAKFVQMVNLGNLKVIFGDNSSKTTTIFEVEK